MCFQVKTSVVSGYETVTGFKPLSTEADMSGIEPTSMLLLLDSPATLTISTPVLTGRVAGLCSSVHAYCDSPCVQFEYIHINVIQTDSINIG